MRAILINESFKTIFEKDLEGNMPDIILFKGRFYAYFQQRMSLAYYREATPVELTA